LHQLFSFGDYCERLCAPEYMTDGIRPFQQISGNLREFQAAISFVICGAILDGIDFPDCPGREDRREINLSRIHDSS
jgi:hypothetical protein